MTTRRRLLKVGKWTAAGLFVLSVAAWVDCLRFAPRMVPPHLMFTVGITFGNVGPCIGYGRQSGSTRDCLPAYFAIGGGWGVIIPYWIPTLTSLGLVMVLFILDRRRILPGHCRCGYNLTGNVSGVCPECGTEITKSS